MALYYLDPEREPRECGMCEDGTYAPEDGGGWHERCPFCHGTGRLGVEGAEPEIDVTCPDGELWIAEVLIPGKTKCRYFEATTESAALEAARKAHREVCPECHGKGYSLHHDRPQPCTRGCVER